MASPFSGTLRGFSDFQRRLEKMSKEDATKAGQIANRAGAAILAKEVRKEAPNSPKTTEGEVRTRHNKGGSTRQEVHKKIVNNIKVRKVKAGKLGEVKNAVTVGGAYQATFVEFGSIHNTANPFMLNALNASEQPIINTIAKVLNKQLVKRGV